MIDISQINILSAKEFDQHKGRFKFQQKLQLVTCLSQNKVNIKLSQLDIKINVVKLEPKLTLTDCLRGTEGRAKMTQHKSKRKALRGGKQGLIMC